jgi:hypothetical protein
MVAGNYVLKKVVGMQSVSASLGDLCDRCSIGGVLVLGLL